MTVKAKTGSKWRVAACRCTPCSAFPQHAEWQVCGPELGQCFEFGTWQSAIDFVSRAAANEAQKKDTEQRQQWMSAFEDDEALPVDGAVWVGSREFQWPQVKRYGDA